MGGLTGALIGGRRKYLNAQALRIFLRPEKPVATKQVVARHNSKCTLKIVLKRVSRHEMG